MQKSEAGLGFLSNLETRRDRSMARDKITRQVSDSRAVALARVYLVLLVTLTSATGADVVFTVGSSHKQGAALGGRISKPLKTRKPSSRGLIYPFVLFLTFLF